MKTFTEIIGLWPSCKELAEDIHVGHERVRKWQQRDSIPAEYWADVIAAARLRRLPLTADQLVAAASSGRTAA